MLMRKKKNGLKSILRGWRLYIMLAPAIVYTAIFAYKPMYGILIAFQDYSVKKGVLGSKWVGFEHFERLFNSYWFPILLKNTLVLSLLGLLIGFPAGVILALLFNELKNNRFRLVVQTASYAPHFISTVVMCGMLNMFLSPRSGIINKFIVMLGYDPIYFMQEPTWFKWIYELSGVRGRLELNYFLCSIIQCG